MADNRDVEINIALNDRTGPGAASVTKNVRKVKDEAEKVTKQIGKLPVGEIGGQLGGNLAKSISKGLAPVAEYAGPIIAGIGVVASPLIGATIAGAIIGGVGIGGVLGGVLVASKDARVQGAFKGLSDGLTQRLEVAGGSFVDPVIEGIYEIENAIDGVNLEGIFQDAAQFVEPLAEGVGKLITSVGDGIEDLMANAGPAVDAIADGIALIGEALGEGLSSLADNGDEAGEALRVIFALIAESIAQVFTIVNGLTEFYGVLKKIGSTPGIDLFLKAMGANMEDVGSSAEDASDATNRAAGGIQNAGNKADEAAPKILTAAEALEQATTAGRNLYDSQTSAAEGIDRATEAAKKNGRTLDSNTEKGRANRTALSNLANALGRNYTEYVKVNGAGAGAEKVAGRNYDAFVKAARGFGLSASAAKTLANRILGIPAKRSTTATFKAPKRDVDAYGNAIRGIPSYRKSVVEIAAKITGSSASQSALKSALGKQSLNFAGSGYATFAAASFATAQSSGGTVGGPAEVNVSNEVKVSLDGRAFYDMTAKAISEETKRQQYRTQVGKRY